MTMTERQIINLIEITLNEKMEQNENFIRYSFYEVNIKYCLKGAEEQDKEEKRLIEANRKVIFYQK